MQKSQKKKTLAKKPRQRKVDKDDNTIVLDLGDHGAAQPYDNVSYTSGIDTITLDNITLDPITINPTWNTTWNTTNSTISTTSSGYTVGSSVIWNNNYNPAVNITSDGITMKEGSDIKVGGKSLIESIEKIEERLAILKPNEALEDRWEQLKALRQQYIDLEKELLEKEKMWKILKEK